MLLDEDAQVLADINGLRRDLRLVEQACTVIDIRKGEPGAEHIRRACFDSAVMRYRRCFNGGIRDLFPKILMIKLTQRQLELHNRILDLANKSVAHCVDGSEENFTYFVLDRNISPASVEINVYTKTVSHHNKMKITKLRDLAQKLEKLLAEEGVRVANKVLANVQSMSMEDAEHLPALQSNITEDGDQLVEKYKIKVRKKSV